MNFRRNFYRIARSVNRNLPTIFSAGAVVGLGITTYLTSKKTPIVTSLLRKVDLDSPSKQEESKALIKEAFIESIPVVVSFAITGGLIFSADSINRRRIQAMGAAYNNLARSFNEYKLAAISGLGVDGYNKLQNEYAKKYVKKEPPFVEDGKHIFFDEFSKQTFEASLADVLEAEYNVNRHFALNGYATVNEFYEYLGIDKIDGGDILCWSFDSGFEYYGYQWIDFINHENIDEDGGKWYSIIMPFEPTMDDYLHYLDYGTSIVTDGAGEITDSQKLHGIG